MVSHFGIASTPVMALWENGFPRYRLKYFHFQVKLTFNHYFRLYDDFSKLDSLIRVIHAQTDLRKILPNFSETSKFNDSNHQRNTIEGKKDGGSITSDDQISSKEFLGQFKYLSDGHGFDW